MNSSARIPEKGQSVNGHFRFTYIVYRLPFLIFEGK